MKNTQDSARNLTYAELEAQLTKEARDFQTQWRTREQATEAALAANPQLWRSMRQAHQVRAKRFSLGLRD